MSHLLARIMLALLMLPLAGVVYTFMIVMLLEAWSWNSALLAFMLTDVVVAGFVAIYWVLLWRSTVRWTASRIRLSLLAVAACSLCGLVVGVMATPVDDNFGAFIGGIFAITTWPAVTVLIWRERTHERIGRLQRAGASLLP